MAAVAGRAGGRERSLLAAYVGFFTASPYGPLPGTRSARRGTALLRRPTRSKDRPMKTYSWLKSLRNRLPGRARRSIRRDRPLWLERLEDRTVPAVVGSLDPTFGIGGMVLTDFSALNSSGDYAGLGGSSNPVAIQA